MKVTFLGTGTSQGIPVIACTCPVCTSDDPRDNRLRCSVMIEINDKVIVIDSGPDFRQQMLRAGVKDLRALIFTHEHKDHIAGMDDIRAFNYIRQHKVDIYCAERVQKAIQREFHYIFEDKKYPGVPEVNVHLIQNIPFFIDDLEIIPVEVMHFKLPVFGYRINDFTYITDANYISEAEKEKIKGSKALVINALRQESHISHFTLKEAIGLIHELKPEMAYLIHMSHQMGLHKEVNASLPPGIQCAYDGLVLDL